MNHFFLDSHLFSGNRVNFPEDIVHQIIHVLRMHSGEVVEVLDGKGSIYRVQIKIDIDQKDIFGKILEKTPVTTEPKISITLCFGMTSRDKVEWILQKGTEVGISQFFPFISSRSLVQSTDLSEKRIMRWERIIREAAEQAHRGRLPSLLSPKDYMDCLKIVSDQHDLSLIAWEAAETAAGSLRESVRNFDGSKVALFVGPEGGYSDGEIETAKKYGCRVVSLGERILRMETAALVFPAVVLYELGEL
jgi:16S rRNA (uracil1498-N3)-methyltransferase